MSWMPKTILDARNVHLIVEGGMFLSISDLSPSNMYQQGASD